MNIILNVKQYIGNTLNFKSHIRQNQWEGLLEKSVINGVTAGIICWFIDHDLTVFLDIEYLDFLKEKGYKSFNITKDSNFIPTVILYGKKKRVHFDYDLKRFMGDLSYE